MNDQLMKAACRGLEDQLRQQVDELLEASRRRRTSLQLKEQNAAWGRWLTLPAAPLGLEDLEKGALAPELISAELMRAGASGSSDSLAQTSSSALPTTSANLQKPALAQAR